MEPGRTKPDKDTFLGTADIIARVQAAQAKPFARWMGALRWYVLLLCVAAMALVASVAMFRALPRPKNSPARHQGPATPASPAPAGAAHSTAPAQARPALQQVRVVLLHQAGAIWLDGGKVAEKKRAWNGKLLPGNHQLAVRVGGQMMRLTFVVEAESITITVDPSQQSFRVSSASHGHRVGRGH